MTFVAKLKHSYLLIKVSKKIKTPYVFLTVFRVR